MRMPEFPWRCLRCGSDEIYYLGCWGGGGYMDWECRAPRTWENGNRWTHRFTTVQY